MRDTVAVSQERYFELVNAEEKLEELEPYVQHLSRCSFLSSFEKEIPCDCGLEEKLNN